MNMGTFACLYLMKVDGKYTEKIEDLSGLSKTASALIMSCIMKNRLSPMKTATAKKAELLKTMTIINSPCRRRLRHSLLQPSEIDPSPQSVFRFLNLRRPQ